MAEFPLVNKPAISTGDSFSFMIRPCSDLVFPYHMHPDYQLNLVIEGKGTRVVGDHSEEYFSGDLVLLGPNLPHYWTYDEEYLKNHGKGRAIIIHFNRGFAGNDFLQLPALNPVQEMLDQAFRGLKFSGRTKSEMSDRLLSLEEALPLQRLVILIQVLTYAALIKDFEFLAGPAYENRKIPEQELKIKRIVNFMNLHFSDTELSLGKLAAMASMTPTAFSKYFKKQTGQNYIGVLTDIRLSEACKMLSRSDYSIAQIASACGYNNLSNFNKMFRLKYKCTPRQFVKRIGITNHPEF